MIRQGLILLSWSLVGVGLWSACAGRVQAQDVDRMYRYPYYYYPHNYWPTQEKWPDAKKSFQRPPRWMSTPQYLSPEYRYELQRPMRYYRGSHFWLDQF